MTFAIYCRFAAVSSASITGVSLGNRRAWRRRWSRFGGMDRTAIDTAATMLARSGRVLFITGAGISADSGLPTYRGIGGLYDRELVDEGIPIEVALSGGMMLSRPELCWKYIAELERTCRGAEPNRGHEIIAELEGRGVDVCVLTQNVDGFHDAAGSTNVIAMHGDIHELYCTGCNRRERVTDYAGLSIPPSCGECGELVRPAVVLFNEMLPTAALGRLQAEVGRGFDMVFTIGTSSLFPYIAEPVLFAKRSGTPTVEINPGDSSVSASVDLRIRERARVALEAIWAGYLAEAGVS
jgi:NAD-dependent deacetylase